jgi:hypothetical protein
MDEWRCPSMVTEALRTRCMMMRMVLWGYFIYLYVGFCGFKTRFNRKNNEKEAKIKTYTENDWNFLSTFAANFLKLL